MLTYRINSFSCLTKKASYPFSSFVELLRSVALLHYYIGSPTMTGGESAHLADNHNVSMICHDLSVPNEMSLR
jgi:hypothetical protein